MDAHVNSAIAALQCESQGWMSFSHTPLNKLASKIQAWEADLWRHFVPHEWKGEPVTRPEIVFRLERLSRRVFGRYHPGREATALRCVITLNLAHFAVISEVKTAALVLHLLLHCFEELADNAQTGKYHSAWFRRKAACLGIPCPRFGCRCMDVLTGSPFMEWARRSGLRDAPLLSGDSEDEPKRKRIAWVCDCPTTGYFAAGQKVAWTCDECGARAHPKTAKPQTA